MYKLYYAPGTCALAVHIALQEAGAEFETQRVDFKSGEQTKTDYLAINAKGRVPVLVNGQSILTETPAILAFIAQSFPKSGLAPIDDLMAFAQIQAFNAYLCSTVHVAHAHRPRAIRWADDADAIKEMQRKTPEVVFSSFKLIEDSMFARPWVMGDQYTICDPYLYTVARWLESDGVDPDDLPIIRDHRSRVEERPQVQDVLAVHFA